MLTDITLDNVFWVQVAFMASGWLASAPEKELRRHWIDDFEPGSLSLRRTNAAAEIAGRVWVMRHQGGGELLQCSVSIPWRIVNRDRSAFEIDGVEIDLAGKELTIRIRPTSEEYSHSELDEGADGNS